MRLLKRILENTDEFSITTDELDAYIDAVGNQLPEEVKTVCFYMRKAGILTRDDLDGILVSGNAKLDSEARDRGVQPEDLRDLVKIIKKMKLEKLLIPVYQSVSTRNDFIRGDKNADDVMLDLVSEKGRTDIVKQFTPLMNKIATQYLGKSSLSKAELLSAAMMGLVQAMNDYRKNEEELSDGDTEVKKMHRLSFKQYAGYRIKQRILSDINWNSRTVRVPSRTASRHKDDRYPMSSSVYIDQAEDSDAIDRLIGAAIHPKTMELPSSAKRADDAMKSIYKMIEDRFSQQKAIVFYYTFGLNGYDSMRQTDIAKKFNMSTQNISMSNKRIAKFLRETPAAQPLLKALLQHVQESILCDSMRSSAEEITEAFMSNDMYLLLEDLTRLSDPIILERSLREVIAEYDSDSAECIIGFLNKGAEMPREEYKNNKRLIVHFLESLNPTQSISKRSDAVIIDELDIVSTAYKSAKITL